MKRTIVFYLSMALLASLISCYPGGAEYYEELDIVYTNYDDEFDFASKGTYSMPDKIVKITGNLAEGETPEFITEPYNSQIITKIASNMAANGWTRVDSPNTADLVLLPAVWTNTTVYYWYDYWCWYYYYYYCGWGYPMVYSYTTGTLVMALTANGVNYIEPSGVWLAAANGVLSGEFDVTRVNNAIDRAFSQSPYLNTK